jgi:hypothetical protein
MVIIDLLDENINTFFNLLVLMFCTYCTASLFDDTISIHGIVWSLTLSFFFKEFTIGNIVKEYNWDDTVISSSSRVQIDK